MCFLMSLASALHYFRIKTVAHQVSEWAEDMIGSSFKVLYTYAAKGLHKLNGHLQPRKWQEHHDLFDLPSTHIAVIVMRDSDGQAQHAVTICNNWVFDSNEKNALPLSREVLDYCTWGSNTKSRFCNVDAGLIVEYRAGRQKVEAKLEWLDKKERERKERIGILEQGLEHSGIA